MSLTGRRIQWGKRCFIYCGNRCDCGASASLEERQIYEIEVLQKREIANGLALDLAYSLILRRPVSFRLYQGIVALVLEHPAVKADPYRRELIPTYNELYRQWKEAEDDKRL